MPVPTRMMMVIMLRPAREGPGCAGAGRLEWRGEQRGWPGGRGSEDLQQGLHKCLGSKQLDCRPT